MSDGAWSLIVHGGARTIPPDLQAANRRGCLAAAERGAAILRRGGTALEAAEQAVRELEDDPTFNAGSGSVPTSSGQIEMDAAIMDGRSLEIGAVAAVRGISNPVAVARLLLKEKTVLLVGEGAQTFAAEQGIASSSPASCSTAEPQCDTVGCVARDVHGNIAVATSTGGLTGQRPGRVGDAPIPGCGFYADNQVGGVAISGDGESILRVSLAARVILQMQGKSPTESARTALAALDRIGGEAGIIAVGRDGRFGFAHNSDHFAMAIAASWLDYPQAGIHWTDLEGYAHDA
jgi:beta-aspartyl-peptidase (threonine type)